MEGIVSRVIEVMCILCNNLEPSHMYCLGSRVGYLAFRNINDSTIGACRLQRTVDATLSKVQEMATGAAVKVAHNGANSAALLALFPEVVMFDTFSQDYSTLFSIATLDHIFSEPVVWCLQWRHLADEWHSRMIRM